MRGSAAVGEPPRSGNIERPRYQVVLDRRSGPTRPLHTNDVMQQLALSCPSASDEQQPRLTDRPDGLHGHLHSSLNEHLFDVLEGRT
jgi:hypothetical protein